MLRVDAAVSRWIPIATVPALLLLAAPPAEAGPPGVGEGLDADLPTPQIAWGEAVPECAWPTTVAVTSGGGLCTGTLIHPQVVVYAAHCGGNKKTIRLSSDAFEGGRTLPVSYCTAFDEYGGTDDQGRDWAFCVLSEPVTDLPVSPTIYGCEIGLLQTETEVAVAGYGATLEGPGGVKHWGMSRLVAFTAERNTTLIGNPNEEVPSICPGDSGGPAFVYDDDAGAWRPFGIASTVTGECGGYGAHAVIAGAVRWIEATSGIDVTPCHTSDGRWAPGPDCAGFNAQAANAANGSWDDWCAGTPALGKLRSCGPAWDEFDAALLPDVAIASPRQGDVIPAGELVDIEIDARKHEEGFALKQVALLVDGVEVAVDAVDPWSFDEATFPPDRVYTLVAVAEDWAGNVVESEPVVIATGDATVPAEGGDGGSPASEGGGSNCALAATTPGWSGTLALLALLGIARRRRQRSHEVARASV